LTAWSSASSLAFFLFSRFMLSVAVFSSASSASTLPASRSRSRLPAASPAFFCQMAATFDSVDFL
jgi:hypothetical protein